MCFLETSIIHESGEPKIFDVDEIKWLSDNIKSEALAYRLNMEEQGRVPGEIAQDVFPTTQSYRDAASPPPGRRAPANPVIAQQGENAGASQASGSGLVRGENAGGSQSSGSGLSRGDNAGICPPSAPETDTGNAPSLFVEKIENGSESEEENASAEEVSKRVEKIMHFVSNVYGTDDSRIFKKREKLHLLPRWATDLNIGKCVICDLLHEVDQPEGTEERLKCSDCSGQLVVARDVATPLSELPWTSSTITLAKEAMEHNRRVHDLRAHGVVKDESKESKGKGRQPCIHQCFGHDQRATYWRIQGLRQKVEASLAREMAERNASTEIAGVFKTVRNSEVQEDDDDVELKGKGGPSSM